MLIQRKKFPISFFRKNVVLLYCGSSDWAIQYRWTFNSRQPPTFPTPTCCKTTPLFHLSITSQITRIGTTEIVGLVVGIRMSVCRQTWRTWASACDEGNNLSGKIAGMKLTLKALRDGASLIRNNHNSIRGVTCDIPHILESNPH